ncbi:hypothetical protein METY_1316 [Methylopila sp. Yamaguchi]|nr:hypothetical protein METY_1316 [Methylopila sp. Yamaguchi]
MIVGILGWVAGALILLTAQGAIHEGIAIVSMGLSTLTIGISAILGWLSKISGQLQSIEISANDVRMALVSPEDYTPSQATHPEPQNGYIVPRPDLKDPRYRTF